MNGVTENTILRRLFQVTHQLEQEGELAVFDDSRSELVMLNTTAGAIWESINGRATLGEIALELKDAAEGAPELEDVRAYVLEFAGKLLDRKAVEVVER